MFFFSAFVFLRINVQIIAINPTPRLSIKFPWNMELKLIVNKMSAFWNSQTKSWELLLSDYDKFKKSCYEVWSFFFFFSSFCFVSFLCAKNAKNSSFHSTLMWFQGGGEKEEFPGHLVGNLAATTRSARYEKKKKHPGGLGYQRQRITTKMTLKCFFHKSAVRPLKNSGGWLLAISFFFPRFLVL